MGVKTRVQLKQAFAQGAWPQASDYSDMMDSFALVDEIPDVTVTPQQVVKVPAGTIGNGERFAIDNKTGRYPCVNVYVEKDGLWVELRDAEVALEGMKRVFVTVSSSSPVDVKETGMVVVLC